MQSINKLLKNVIKNDKLRQQIKGTLDKYKIGYRKYYKLSEKIIFKAQIGGEGKVIKLGDGKFYEYHIDGVSVSQANSDEYEVNFLTLNKNYGDCASLIYVKNEKSNCLFNHKFSRLCKM